MSGRYVLGRIGAGAISYVLIVPAYTAVLSPSLEATKRREIRDSVRAMLPPAGVAAKGEAELLLWRTEVVAAMERNAGLDRPYSSRILYRATRILPFD